MFGYATRETPGADAAADRPRPSAGRAAGRGPQGRHARLSAPRRQDPGQRPLRRRPARGGREAAHLHPARRGHASRGCARTCSSTSSGPCCPPSSTTRRAACRVPGQPDRALRDRWPRRRLRSDRAQDHRRHLRRHGSSRRRRVQRQGSVQGRPLGGLRRALGGQERRRRRARLPLRGPGRLRDRRRPTRCR